MNVQSDPTRQVPLLEEKSLSKTEEDILLNIYRNPSVIKHLQIMALNALAELASLNSLEKDEKFLGRAHALVSGKLAVLQTLLDIANIPASQTLDSQESQ